MRKRHLYKLSAISFKFKNLQKDCTKFVSCHARVTSTNRGVTREANELHNPNHVTLIFVRGDNAIEKNVISNLAHLKFSEAIEW